MERSGTQLQRNDRRRRAFEAGIVHDPNGARRRLKHALGGQANDMAYGAEDFSRMALAEFPELAEDFEEWSDLLHLKMGAFARITQAAKGEGDWEKYARCVRFADKLYADPSPELENALNVSYLEHLDFDGPRGSKAWECLTPRLKVGWKDMQQYLEDLARKNPGGRR